MRMTVFFAVFTNSAKEAIAFINAEMKGVSHFLDIIHIFNLKVQKRLFIVYIVWLPQKGQMLE